MNHITKNLITKGWLNISSINKGFILPGFKYEITKKSGGSPLYGNGYYELERDLFKIKNKDDIQSIKVYVDWNKKVSRFGKIVYADLIKKNIEAKLLENTNNRYIILVEIEKN